MGEATREDEAVRGRGANPPCARRLVLGGEEFVVLEWSPSPAVLDPLSAAEADVARLLLAGASNAEIAGARHRSLGTVAKQVAGVFQKLRVRSRSELYAKAGAGAAP